MAEKMYLCPDCVEPSTVSEWDNITREEYGQDYPSIASDHKDEHEYLCYICSHAIEGDRLHRVKVLKLSVMYFPEQSTSEEIASSMDYVDGIVSVYQEESE